MTRSLRYISTEVRYLPSYDGLGGVNTFLNDYEEKVQQNQTLSALDIASKATLARWWNAHKKNIGGWQEFRRLMGKRFGQIDIEMEIKYDGENNPRKHNHLCTIVWKGIPQ